MVYVISALNKIGADRDEWKEMHIANIDFIVTVVNSISIIAISRLPGVIPEEAINIYNREY